MWHVRKLAFALKFRSCNLRNLLGLLYEAAIFSEFKSKILFFIEMTSFICHIVHCKDGPYRSLIQGNKIHNAQVLLTAKPGPLPAPFACILGEFCETALMSRSPSDRMVRSGLVFSPFRAEPRHAGWSIPVPGGGGTAAEPPLRPLLAVGAKCSSCSARTFPGVQYTVLC